MAGTKTSWFVLDETRFDVSVEVMSELVGSGLGSRFKVQGPGHSQSSRGQSD